jgi:hypothetical protein
MKITYSIQVCNESRELFSLLNFLKKVIDEEDNIQVIVDSLHVTDKVEKVLEHFKDSITEYRRPFDSFHSNTMSTMEKVTGDYIFAIDADEMPQEALIKELKKVLEMHNVDILYVPRINIHPGSTQEFLTKSEFGVNENGWINWPDYQGRILKKHVKWTDELHSKPVHDENIVGSLGPNPRVALWHIKSIEKQESRWVDNNIASPTPDNLYDLLM